MNGVLKYGTHFVGKINDHLFNSYMRPWMMYYTTDGNGTAQSLISGTPNWVPGNTGFSGDELYFSVTPSAGYVFSGITYTGAGTGQGQYYVFGNGDCSATIYFDTIIPHDGVIYFTKFNNIDNISASGTSVSPAYWYSKSAKDIPIESNWYTSYPDDPYYTKKENFNYGKLTYYSNSVSIPPDYSSYPITSNDGSLPASYVGQSYVEIGKPLDDNYSLADVPYTYSGDYTISYWYKHCASYIPTSTDYGDDVHFNMPYITTIIRPFGMYTIDEMEGICLSIKQAGDASENDYGLGSAAAVSCYNGAATAYQMHGGGGLTADSMKWIQFPSSDKEWHYYSVEIVGNRLVKYYRDGVHMADVSSNMYFVNPQSITDEMRHNYMIYYGSKLYRQGYTGDHWPTYPASGMMAELYVRLGTGSGDIVPTQPITIVS